MPRCNNTHTGDTVDLAEVQTRNDLHAALRDAGLTPGTQAYNNAFIEASEILDMATEILDQDWWDY